MIFERKKIHHYCFTNNNTFGFGTNSKTLLPNTIQRRSDCVVCFALLFFFILKKVMIFERKKTDAYEDVYGRHRGTRHYSLFSQCISGKAELGTSIHDDIDKHGREEPET